MLLKLYVHSARDTGWHLTANDNLLLTGQSIIWGESGSAVVVTVGSTGTYMIFLRDVQRDKLST